MTDHNPFAAPESSPVDLPEVSTDSEVNWPAFAGAGMGLNFVFWGLVLFVPATIFLGGQLDAALRRTEGNVLPTVLIGALYFGIVAQPIIGGIVCLSAPVSGLAKAQLIASSILQAVPWMWVFLRSVSSGRMSTPFDDVVLLVFVGLLAISTVFFLLFLQSLATEIRRQDLAVQGRTITRTLTWLSALLVIGTICVRFLVGGSFDMAILSVSDLLFSIWTCLVLLWFIMYASFLNSLRKAISQGGRPGHWP